MHNPKKYTQTPCKCWVGWISGQILCHSLPKDALVDSLNNFEMDLDAFR